MLNQLSKSLLATISLAIGGIIINPQQVSASTISSGSISIFLLEPVVFANNAIDFGAFNTFFPGFFDDGPTDFVPGDLDEGGNFVTVNAEGDFLELSFLGAPGIITDFFTPSFAIPTFNSLGEGAFLDEIFYDLVEIFSDNNLPGLEEIDGFQGIPLLFFDLDGDGDFEDDAIFFQTGFVRSMIPVPTTSSLTINFEGFFASPSGLFEPIISDIAILAGGFFGVAPEDLGVVTGDPPLDLDGFFDATGLDFEISTFDGFISVSTPEPRSIMGLGIFLGVIGLLNKKRNSKLDR